MKYKVFICYNHSSLHSCEVPSYVNFHMLLDEEIPNLNFESMTNAV